MPIEFMCFYVTIGQNTEKRMRALILFSLIFSLIACVPEHANKPVYMVIETAVNDRDMYDQYIAQVSPIVEKYGGTYLVRSESITSLTGNWMPQRIIILRFDSMDNLTRCFQSPEYTRIAALRENSTRSKAIIIEGSTP